MVDVYNEVNIGEELTEIKQYQRKIIMLEMQNEDLIKKNLEDIRTYNITIELKKILIKDYMKAKGLEKFDNLVGYASFQKQQDKHSYDLPKLLEWAKADKAREKYIKVIEEFRKQELKDDVKSGELKIEEVDGYDVEPQLDKFVVKIKGM